MKFLIPFSLQKGGKKAKFCLEFVQINKEYRIGLRAVKTAIAVFVCAVISTIITHEEDIFCSCIAAVICMQPTCEQTLQALLLLAKDFCLAVWNFSGHLYMQFYKPQNFRAHWLHSSHSFACKVGR